MRLGSGLLFGIASVAMVVAATPTYALTVSWNTCTDGTDTGSKCTPNDTLTPSARTTSGSGVDQTITFQGLEDASKLLIAEAFQTTNSSMPSTTSGRTSSSSSSSVRAPSCRRASRSASTTAETRTS